MYPVQVGFSWSFTRETLLACELTELERLLAGRQEVLAMLHPLSSSRVLRLMNQAGSDQTLLLPGTSSSEQLQQWQLPATDSRSTGVLLQGSPDSSSAATGPPPQQQQEYPSSESEAGGDSDSESSYLFAAANTAGSPLRSRRGHPDNPGTTRIIKCPDVFAGLNLGLADSSVVALEVGIVEVANLAPRSGWSQDLTHSLLSSAAAGNARGADSSSASTVLMETAKQEDLPLPVVYAFCGAGGPGDKGFEVGWYQCWVRRGAGLEVQQEGSRDFV